MASIDLRTKMVDSYNAFNGCDGFRTFYDFNGCNGFDDYDG